MYTLLIYITSNVVLLDAPIKELSTHTLGHFTCIYIVTCVFWTSDNRKQQQVKFTFCTNKIIATMWLKMLRCFDCFIFSFLLRSFSSHRFEISHLKPSAVAPRRMPETIVMTYGQMWTAVCSQNAPPVFVVLKQRTMHVFNNPHNRLCL